MSVQRERINMERKTVVRMISELEMLGFLKANGTNCQFVSILTDTPVKNVKAACPFKAGLRKVSRRLGIINANYNDSVRRRIAAKLGVEMKDVEYEAGEVWYRHLMTSDDKALPVVVNKTKNDGKHYLQFFAHKTESKYFLSNGDEIPVEQVASYFYDRKREDFKPNTIAVDLANVKELRASGVIIEMPDLEAAESLLAD